MSRRVLLVSTLALASACTGKYIRPTTDLKAPSTPEAVARGQYIVNQLAMCGACHTPRQGGDWLQGERADAFLGGGQIFKMEEVGVVLPAPNISQDVETGIGGWTDDQILRAIRDGIDKNGKLLGPPMPFGAFGKMADEDALAVVAYLRTTPPVKNAVDRSKKDFGKMGFPLKLGLMHHLPAKDVKAPPRTDKLAYGRYLVSALAPCNDCHGLSDRGPSEEPGKFMAGGTMSVAEPAEGKIFARNLTSDIETGLGKYGADQIKEALKTGKRLDGKPMAPPMARVIPHVSGLTEEDMDAVVTFIRSLPPVKHKVPEPELSAASQKSMGL